MGAAVCSAERTLAVGRGNTELSFVFKQRVFTVRVVVAGHAKILKEWNTGQFSRAVGALFSMANTPLGTREFIEGNCTFVGFMYAGHCFNTGVVGERALSFRSGCWEAIAANALGF